MDIDYRTEAQLLEHYELEKKLASKLMNSTKSERKSLYSALYDELFKKIPSHPQLTRKTSAEETENYVNSQLLLLNKFLTADANYLEVGPGDCSLAYKVAKKVNHVFAIDVSDEITRAATVPDNFTLILSDGSSIPVEPNSIDVAYSNQLMEHLHPQDAQEQLTNIFTALVKGGKYICITPNQLSGPHDISMLYDDVATGFHLKEYTNQELITLFKQVGFTKVLTYIGGKGLYLKLPLIMMTSLEKIISTLPTSLSKKISRMSRGILQNCQIVGIK